MDREYPISPWEDDHHRYIEQEEEPDNSEEVSWGKEADDAESKGSKNLLWAYIKEVGRFPLLSENEEKILAEEIQNAQTELVGRLVKLDLTVDKLDMIRRKERNISDELLAAIMGVLKKLEKENKISPNKIPLLPEIRDLYGWLNRLKGEMLSRNLRLVIKIA